MRKVLALATVVGMILAVSAVGPLGAAPADKDTYELVECFTLGTPDRSWFSGQDDKIWHMRGLANSTDLFWWDGGAWQNVGTNATVGNWNARWAGEFPFIFPTKGSLWGTFSMRSDVGDFDGSWAWGNWPANDGRGAGSGVGGSAGTNVKVTLSQSDPTGGSGPYPCVIPSVHQGMDFVTLEVIDTK